MLSADLHQAAMLADLSAPAKVGKLLLQTFYFPPFAETIMAKKQSTRSSSKSKSSSGPDAIMQLRADHDTVKKLFKQFEKSEDDGEKVELAATICNELTVHAAIEEELFYPAAKQALDEEDVELLDEAEVEHASAKDLIAQIQGGSPDDELWEAKVSVLGEYIDHHVQEEQEEIFPKVRKSELDLKALGQQIEARKTELEGMANQGAAARSGRSASQSNGARGARANA
jgi:hemerythrin superfamily protein